MQVDFKRNDTAQIDFQQVCRLDCSLCVKAGRERALARELLLSQQPASLSPLGKVTRIALLHRETLSPPLIPTYILMTVSVSVTHLEFCPSFRLVLVTQIRCNSLAVIKTLHHVHELFEVDFTVTILVDFHDSLCDLLLCVEVLKFIAADELQNLLVVDFAAAIDIKHGEGRLQVGLLSKDLGVHRCRQKFCHTHGLFSIS